MGAAGVPIPATIAAQRPKWCSACGRSDLEAQRMVAYNSGDFLLCNFCIDLSHEVIHRPWHFDEFGEHFAAEVLPCA